ncbi:hypothetical protein ACFQS3_08690 [Glycomyces mayteni]|uniref:Transmembrane protein n=1 Tax=Glycomyces mayteni TaxID=543887 RepID=A0ABW2D950_9ACTN
MESRMNPEEARAALADVDRTRSDIADRLYTPWWYHPILGVLIGGLAAVAGSGARLAIVWGAVGAFAIGAYLLATAYRRITGVWVDGYSGGPRSRRSAMNAVFIGIAIAAVGAVFGLGFELWWPSVAAGIVLAVLTTVWGRHFDRLLRADLREAA